MATRDGIRLLEYNARFGDPETLNVLSILKTDFVDICEAIINGTLDSLDIEFHRLATVCKYVVPNGYPDDPVKGERIDLSRLPAADSDQRQIADDVRANVGGDPSSHEALLSLSCETRRTTDPAPDVPCGRASHRAMCRSSDDGATLGMDWFRSTWPKFGTHLGHIRP